VVVMTYTRLEQKFYWLCHLCLLLFPSALRRFLSHIRAAYAARVKRCMADGEASKAKSSQSSCSWPLATNV
jgi:hypothetical protein